MTVPLASVTRWITGEVSTDSPVTVDEGTGPTGEALGPGRQSQGNHSEPHWASTGMTQTGQALRQVPQCIPMGTSSVPLAPSLGSPKRIFSVQGVRDLRCRVSAPDSRKLFPHLAHL